KIDAERNVIDVHEDGVVSVTRHQTVEDAAGDTGGIGASIGDEDFWHGQETGAAVTAPPRLGSVGIHREWMTTAASWIMALKLWSVLSARMRTSAGIASSPALSGVASAQCVDRSVSRYI